MATTIVEGIGAAYVVFGGLFFTCASASFICCLTSRYSDSSLRGAG